MNHSSPSHSSSAAPKPMRRRIRLAAILLLLAASATFTFWPRTRVDRAAARPSSAGVLPPEISPPLPKASRAPEPTKAASEPSPSPSPSPSAGTSVPPGLGVAVPGHFEGIMVINQPEPPPPPVLPGTPRTPGKIYPNPPGVGGFVVETDETWAVETKAPPLR